MNKTEFYAKLSTPTNDPANLALAAMQGDGKAEVYLRGVYDQFLAFSVEVTAFSRFDLEGTGQGEAYFATVIQVVGYEILEQLLDTFTTIINQTGGQSPLIRNDMLRRRLFGNERLGPIARNIVKLWFTGNWYQLPRNWSEKFGPAPKDVTFTVSANAYVEGLLWTTIGAHPAGAKAQGYGSWANPPRIPEFGSDAVVR
ncbi:MAG: hypothetical protein H7829_16700 [Magnetococcus sp. THC-1_WYH]